MRLKNKSLRNLFLLPFRPVVGDVVAQDVPGAVCEPVSQRTQDIGCWSMSDDPI